MKYCLTVLLLLFFLSTNALTIDISKNGARNDGITNNTKIIQNAIDECNSKGGGTILITGGGKYMSGTIFLKSNTTLRIENGTTLLASPNISDYSMNTHKIMYKKEAHMDRCFIYAENANSFALEGNGTIDGNGSKKNFSIQRPMLIRFKDCNKISLKDLTLMNPAAWTSAWLYCNNINVTGIKISSRVNNNGDGLDFDGCNNVHVNNSSFDTSDDCICLQTSKKDKPCKNIVINNCTFISKWAGVRIGLLSMAEISSVTVSNCTFNDISDAGLKIQQNEAGCMSDMVFSNLVMRNVPRPIFMTFCKQRACVDEPQDKLDELKYMKHFLFNNIIINNEELDKNSAIIFSAIPKYYIEDISINNLKFIVAGGGTSEDAKRKYIPEFDLESMKSHWPEFYCLKAPIPTYGLFLRHIKNINLSNISIITKNKDKRALIKTIDVKKLTKENVK